MNDNPNNISNNYSTGVVNCLTTIGYWKKLNLDKANKTYAKLMGNKKYEDSPRARVRE